MRVTPFLFFPLLLLILFWKTLADSFFFLKAALFICLYRVIRSHLLFSLSWAWYVWLSLSLLWINISSPLVICVSIQWLVNIFVQWNTIFQMPAHQNCKKVISAFLCQGCQPAGTATWTPSTSPSADEWLGPWLSEFRALFSAPPKHTEQLYCESVLFVSVVDHYEWRLYRILWKTKQRPTLSSTWKKEKKFSLTSEVFQSGP